MDDSDDSEEENSLPSHSLSPTTPFPPSSMSQANIGPCCSGREHKLTEKGAAWTAELAATHACLDAIAECHHNVTSTES